MPVDLMPKVPLSKPHCAERLQARRTTRPLWIVTPLIAAIVSGAVSAAAPPNAGFTDLDSAIKALHPDHELLETAIGDLNEDGRPEIVVSLRAPKSDEGHWAQQLRIVVFTTNEQGRLALWTESDVGDDCPHSTAVEIDRHSLFLGCTSSLGVGGADNVSIRLQFAVRRGALRHIGDRLMTIEHMNEANEAIREVSRNLLTGEIVDHPAKGRDRKRVDPAIKAEAVTLKEWSGW